MSRRNRVEATRRPVALLEQLVEQLEALDLLAQFDVARHHRAEQEALGRARVERALLAAVAHCRHGHGSSSGSSRGVRFVRRVLLLLLITGEFVTVGRETISGRRRRRRRRRHVCRWQLDVNESDVGGRGRGEHLLLLLLLFAA